MKLGLCVVFLFYMLELLKTSYTYVILYIVFVFNSLCQHFPCVYLRMKKLTQDFIEYVYEVQLVPLDRVKLYLVLFPVLHFNYI